MGLKEKLSILSDAAKYDVACTSSGVERKGKKGFVGNSISGGICHSFSADGRCISLLKILFTNQCIYDCKYCVNRCSNDVVRTAYTMELLHETLWKLRNEHRFRGYIHIKAIPGADPALIERTGFLADRMSINLELPTADGLKRLCPGKTREKILTPMRQIQTGIRVSKNELALYRNAPRFVPAGQSTQMIVGATAENDFQMVSVAEALYKNYQLKRVFYSAFVPVVEDANLPALAGGPPLLREHRLYQADWLLRFYGFEAKELLSESRPNFNILLDPKCDWAVRHLEEFPVEVMTADYRTLLRVPGLGVRSAKRITAARRTGCLDFSDLKKFGVVLKRAMYFLTCGGKMMTPVRMEENFITSQLVGEEHRKAWDIEHGSSYRQLSLFDDMKLTAVPSGEDGKKALYGEM